MRICYSLDSWSHFFCSHFYITLHGEYGMTILTTPFPSFSSESNPYSIHLLKPINLTHSSQYYHFNWIHLFGDWIPFYSPCSYPFWFITPFLNLLTWNMNEFFHSVFSVSILPTPSKPIQYESHIHNHELNHPYSAVEAPDIIYTIATQPNKSYHTQSIHESDSRKSRNSSTTPRMFPQPLSHHREPWRWYP